MLIRSYIIKLLNLSRVRNASNLKELRNLYNACEIHARNLILKANELESIGNLLFSIIQR